MAQPPRPTADAGISIGQVFLGKYRVDAILGHGGMGVVAECTHLGLNERVAMKMLRQDVLLDRDATERFMREAQAASKLRSEHVARVVDVGTFHDTGVPYMVMEFLDGHNLEELIEQRGTIPAPWASMLMLQAAEALAEAHSIGIVHRDVKPSNLFVTWRPDGTAIVKVLDFGISKAPMGTDMQLTQTQSVLGTPAYMSPEQMRSARLVDARTDIWSLGTVFYELLEGRRPFEAESFSEMCVKVAVDSPEPMVNTPPAVQQVVLRCLAKSPEQRYASMAELGRDLIPFVQDVHQASLLVERMQRMLGRRSHVDWEQGGTNGRGTVQPVRDIKSAPIAVPQWRHDSSPTATAIPATPYTTQLDSAPARAASEVTVSRRRKLPWLLLSMFIAVGIGLGFLAIQLSSNDDDSEATRVRAPDTTINDKAAPVTAATPDKPAPVDKPVDKPAIVDKTVPEITVEKDTKADEAITDITSNKPPIKRPGTVSKRPPIKVLKDRPKDVPKETPVKDPNQKPACKAEDIMPSGKCATANSHP